MGPSHDVGFRMIAQKIRDEKGITKGTGPDPRAFKPRTASLIAVGGSEWDTLALPIMGMFALTLQMTVVDQILINWIGLPKVVTFHEDKLARAHRSGTHVVESYNKGVENAEYIGDPGMCPLCHCKLIEVRNGADPYPVHLRGLRRARHAERGGRQGPLHRQRRGPAALPPVALGQVRAPAGTGGRVAQAAGQLRRGERPGQEVPRLSDPHQASGP